MIFPKLSGFIIFFQTFQAWKLACFKIQWLYHDRLNPECDDRVRLSKSDKYIGAGGWRVDNLFEAADSGDILAHLHITNAQ